MYMHVKNSNMYMPVKDSNMYIHVKDGIMYMYVKDSNMYMYVKDSNMYMPVKDGNMYIRPCAEMIATTSTLSSILPNPLTNSQEHNSFRCTRKNLYWPH